MSSLPFVRLVSDRCSSKRDKNDMRNDDEAHADLSAAETRVKDLRATVGSLAALLAARLAAEFAAQLAARRASVDTASPSAHWHLIR